MGKMVRNLLNAMMIVLIIVQAVGLANNPSFSSLCPYQPPIDMKYSKFQVHKIQPRNINDDPRLMLARQIKKDVGTSAIRNLK